MADTSQQICNYDIVRQPIKVSKEVDCSVNVVEQSPTGTEQIASSQLSIKVVLKRFSNPFVQHIHLDVINNQSLRSCVQSSQMQSSIMYYLSNNSLLKKEIEEFDARIKSLVDLIGRACKILVDLIGRACKTQNTIYSFFWLCYTHTVMYSEISFVGA